LAERVNPSVIYAAAPHYSTLFLGYWLSKVRRIPLVVDIRDDWQENRLRQGKAATIRAIESRWEERILRHSTIILAPTEEGIKAIQGRHPDIGRQKFVLLPNGVDMAEFRGVRSASQKGRRFRIICSSGGLSSRYRDIQTFLNALAGACSVSREFKQDVVLEILGSDLGIEYKDFVRRQSLDSVVRTVIGLSRKEYITRLRSADCLLLVQMDTAQSSIPGTLYEYCAVGKVPILLIGGRGATRSFIDHNRLGYAFEFGDDQAVQRELLAIHRSWKRHRPVQFPRCFDLLDFDRKQIAARFDSILQRAAQ
jgi:glycosyltransferase involved in cell wall biosynthesis